MTTGNREDYLINILRLTENKEVAKTTELAAMMDVSAASVSEMLKTLSGEGMVDYEKYKGVSLTEKGREYAVHLRRKHHIMERFLINVLDADEDHAHEEACKMEHVISDESADKMCRMLGPTEECDDCGETCNVRGRSGTTLTSLAPASTAVISHIKGGDPSQVRKLISMGFVPGRSVRTDRSNGDKGPRIYRIGDSNVAIGPDLTDLVFIDTGSSV